MSYEGQNANILHVPIVGYVAVTSAVGYSRIGSFTFNKDLFTGLNLTAELVVVLEATNASHAANVRIFDVTHSAVFGADPLLTSVSPTPEKKVATLTGLPSGDTLYELQLKMASGTAPDQVVCSHALLRLTWSDF